MISEALPEQMSGGGAFIVHEDNNTGVLDKTWQEIYDAALIMPVISIMVDEKENSVGVGHNNLAYISNGKGYVVRFFSEGGGGSYVADDANSYPHIV